MESELTSTAGPGGYSWAEAATDAGSRVRAVDQWREIRSLGRNGVQTALPNGRYRSQWYQSGEADGSFCAIGIHGQWLYVDPHHETVIVKLSSQPDPLGDETRQDNFIFFRALSRMAI